VEGPGFSVWRVQVERIEAWKVSLTFSVLKTVNLYANNPFAKFVALIDLIHDVRTCRSFVSDQNDGCGGSFHLGIDPSVDGSGVFPLNFFPFSSIPKACRLSVLGNPTVANLICAPVVPSMVKTEKYMPRHNYLPKAMQLIVVVRKIENNMAN
jgi:hypothetical protein